MNTTPPPASPESEEVLDLLTALVQKSLVVYEEDKQGQGRYRLLETVRQYARDRLLEFGEVEAVRGRHRDWRLALAEEAKPQLSAPEQAVWLERLEVEHDNLRAALAWCVETVVSGSWLVVSADEDKSEFDSAGRTTNHEPLTTVAEKGLRLGGALWPFWHGRGHSGEGREQLTGLLALPGAQARTVARAEALHGAGWLVWDQGDYGAARALFAESLALFRELGFKPGSAGDLEGLAAVAAAQAQSERAARLFGAAEGAREAAGTPLRPADRDEHDRSVATLRTALSEEAFTAAWAAGRALSLPAAVAFASEEVEALR